MPGMDRMFAREQFLPRQYEGSALFERAVESVERGFRNDDFFRGFMGVRPAEAPPALVLLCGPRRAGKTHFSNRLLFTADPSFRMVRAEKDMLNCLVAPAAETRAYREHRGMTHDIMHEVTHHYLSRGFPVLFDTPHVGDEYFPNRKFVNRIRSLGEWSRVPVKVLWCTAPREVRLKRLVDWNSVGVGLPRTTLEAIATKDAVPEIPFPHMVVDTSIPDFRAVGNFLSGTP